MPFDEKIHEAVTRHESRRVSDAETAGEFRILRYELAELSQKQIIAELRIKDLEEEADEIHRKISIGKGVLYGVLFASGSLGLVLADKLKSIMELFR